MQRILLGPVFGMLLSAALPSASLGQGSIPTRGDRVPVTIVLSDRIQPNARFVVQRMPKAAKHDRIVLRSDATGEDLMAAVNALLTARQIEGDIPSTERTIRIRPSGSARAQRKAYPWISRVLTDLRQSAPTDVPGIGQARAHQIWLPAQSLKKERHDRSRS